MIFLNAENVSPLSEMRKRKHRTPGNVEVNMVVRLVVGEWGADGGRVSGDGRKDISSYGGKSWGWDVWYLQ